MHIWAGSGSASGKETVRRKERTPIKTGTIIRKRKSSAKLGLGMDGLASTEDIVKSSPGPSPRRDSGIDSVMASEADSDESIITVISVSTYDVEEDMVRPLNFGSLDGEGNLITIGKMERGAKMLREEEMDSNLHDELGHVSTLSKLKGKGIASMDMECSNREDTDAFSSSLKGLSRIMASNNRMFRASREEEDRIKDSDNNIFAKNKSVGTKHSIPVGLPLPSDILGTPAEDTQAVWHEYAFSGSKNESDSHIISAASCTNKNSSESENELERLFRTDSVHTSEPEGSDGYLSPETSTPIKVKEFVFDSENENEPACYSNVECIPDSETEQKDKYPDIKFTHEIDIDLNLEEEEKEKEPEKIVKNLHEQLWDEISKSVDKALDASQENRRKESIRGFSLKVPRLVHEAKQGLYCSPSPTRSCKSNEMVGEVSSLRETEFCASGLKDCGVGDGDLVTTCIEGFDGDYSAQMRRKDDHATTSLDGISSNIESPISLPVMGRGGRNSPETGLTKDKGGSFESTGLDDETCTLSDSPCRQVKIRVPGDENDGHLSDYKEIRGDSVERENEREIADSERFSPVHQRVIQLMTPKQGRYHTGKNASELGSVVMERQASRYPAKERAFSQPGLLRADQSKDSSGGGSEEWLLGKEGCSEIEEEMERFWKVNSEGAMARFREVMEGMDKESEIEIEREERKTFPVMDRKMKRKMGDLGSWDFTTDENGRVSMGSSQVKFSDAPTIIHRSMPQLDGPNSPPLLAVESPAGSSRSPSPRKRLQKVNRPKSPSLMKSSSSSLGKIFQNSRVEGMEGEIRDLRREVEELKNMVGGWRGNLKGMLILGGYGIMEDRGKDEEGERCGGDYACGGWNLEEKQSKSFEKDLMVPSSINPELEDEDISISRISMGNLGSGESGVSGGLRIDESCATIPQREMGDLSADEVGREGEIAGMKGERWDLKDEKSEECDRGMLGDIGAQGWMIGRGSKVLDSEVRDCELVSEVPLCAGWTGGQSESRTQCPLNIQKLSDLPSLESSEEIERERIKKVEESRKSGTVCGRVTRNEKCGKRGGDNEMGLRGLDEGFDKEYKANRKVEVRYVDSDGNFMDQRDAFRYLSSQFKSKGGGKRREKGKGKEGEKLTGIVGCEHGSRRKKEEGGMVGEGTGGDKKDIRRLGGVVEELRELVLSGMEKGKEKQEGGVCGGERKILEEDECEDEDEDEDEDRMRMRMKCTIVINRVVGVNRVEVEVEVEAEGKVKEK
ncbi:uncharacterized protein EAF02_008505 [Botrytis sinoallii]|uniref:uncharacterized protein n=1 Tax=Botrytis sinoallii TaxID=1463999 RepID=UPI001902554B|nr:uncharacterized protein EAF02_008505 [Botrytis sinoallii]KAF7874528.1 hypothetical protein EAF02_008505 [Botrytis sinoallii]